MPNSTLYFTLPEDVVLTAPGWVEWEGMTISPLPVTDSKTGVFARLRYKDAATAAAKLGARMLTKDEIDLIHKRGFEIKPALQTPGPKMASLEWAKKHDARVHEQLEAMGWDGHTPVSNAGKNWLPGAPKGRAINYGWFTAPPAQKGGPFLSADGFVMWQTPGGAHDENHTDYSQVLMVRKV